MNRSEFLALMCAPLVAPFVKKKETEIQSGSAIKMRNGPNPNKIDRVSLVHHIQDPITYQSGITAGHDGWVTINQNCYYCAGGNWIEILQ